MARFRKVDPRMWGDEKFLRLTPIPPCGQGLWVYLLTCREATSLPGVIVAGEAGLAEALKWPLEAFREAFREALREGLLEVDQEARVLWLPNAPKYNTPESPNVVRSWRDHWDNVPECDLKLTAWRGLRAFCEGLGEPFAKAFAQACAKPSRKPSPNQEQEQEQEPEQEQEQGSCRVGNSTSDSVRRIFDHWKAEHDHPRAKLDPKRKARITAHLKTFDEAKICRAISAAKLDSFLMGENPSGKRYDGIQTLLRDAEQVERLLELAERGTPKRSGGAQQASDARLDRQLDRVMDLSGGDPYELVGPQRRLPA